MLIAQTWYFQSSKFDQYTRNCFWQILFAFLTKKMGTLGKVLFFQCIFNYFCYILEKFTKISILQDWKNKTLTRIHSIEINNKFSCWYYFGWSPMAGFRRCVWFMEDIVGVVAKLFWLEQNVWQFLKLWWSRAGKNCFKRWPQTLPAFTMSQQHCILRDEIAKHILA